MSDINSKRKRTHNKYIVDEGQLRIKDNKKNDIVRDDLNKCFKVIEKGVILEYPLSMNEENEYEIKAREYMVRTGSELSIEYVRHGKYFDNDKNTETRDIYKCKLKRGSREFEFEFGNSIYHSGKYILYGNEYKRSNEDIKVLTYNRMMGRCEFEINKNYKIPGVYDIMSCLIKDDVGSLEDFCLNYGYNVDSIKDNKVYEKALKEYTNMCMLYNEKELEEMNEIMY